MTEPIFDHEKLDVYRLSMDDVAASYPTAKGLAGANRYICDQWIRAAQERVGVGVGVGVGVPRC